MPPHVIDLTITKAERILEVRTRAGGAVVYSGRVASEMAGQLRDLGGDTARRLVSVTERTVTKVRISKADGFGNLRLSEPV